MSSREVEYVFGDATAPLGGGRKIIVHVCNDAGAWGAGFVIAISRRWPEPERRYRDWFRRTNPDDPPFALGAVQYVEVEPDLWVANIIGQHGLTSQAGVPPVRYAAIREGLQNVSAKAKELSASVHLPRIGCGLAGGNWETVGAIVEQELARQGIEVTVYDLPPK
jgi:O-acetyl-ADP-ribose deacetylase (regulator of RNase III)